MQWRSCLVLAFLSVAFAMPVMADDVASSNEESKDKVKTYSLPDNIQLTSAVNIEYDKPRIVIKEVFPQLTADVPNENVDEFNDLVAEIIENAVTEFKKEASENQIISKNIPKSALKNNLYIDFSTSFLQSGKYPIISIRFNIQGDIIGQAHGFHKHVTLNYDLKNGEELTLADLFKSDSDYLKVIADYTNSVLSKDPAANKELINEGTKPTTENFQRWNVKPNGLLFTFEEYQVAPYSAGAQTVLVPYAILNDVIDIDSPINGCVTHKTRCLNSSLLTGGFIDEAMNSIKSNQFLAWFSRSKS